MRKGNECAILAARKARAQIRRPALLFFRRGITLQTKEERRAMPVYVTYSDLIQIGIFIVALVGLVYEIFKGKN